MRRGDPANAHLWLEYPHTRASRWLLRTHRILPLRVRRLEKLAGMSAPPTPASEVTPAAEPVPDADSAFPS